MKYLDLNIYVKKFKKRGTRGAVAIEYGLAASLIAVAAISSVGNAGNSISSVFDRVSSAMLGIRTEADRPAPMGAGTEAPPSDSAAPVPIQPN